MTIKHSGGVFGRNPTFNEIGGTLTTAAQPNITSLGTQAENLAFANGKGIDFSATADSSGTKSNEIFSDYEEGTWTPTVSQGTVTTTATYTKVGRLVTITVALSQFSDTSTAERIEISSLPFNCSENFSTGAVFGERLDISLVVASVRTDNTILLRSGIGSTDFVSVQYDDINDGNDSDIRFSTTYVT